MWNVLAGVAVTSHYVFLAYLIGGGFLAWRWAWTIGTHLLTVGWAALIVTTKVPCPLTALQNAAREHLGERPLRGGFIDIYVRGILYPTGWDRPAQLVVAAVVLVSWAGYVLRRRRRAADGGSSPRRGAREAAERPAARR